MFLLVSRIASMVAMESVRNVILCTLGKICSPSMTACISASVEEAGPVIDHAKVLIS